MVRKLRIQYPEAIYNHVMNRGDHGEDIFRDNSDRERFVRTLQECCVRTASSAHSFGFPISVDSD